MATIYDLINAPAIAAYWETLYSNTIPYIGDTLFPARKQQGLKLDMILGYDKLPVALQPSAFDAKPVLRDRGGIETLTTRMPFFREAMRLGEETRQQLLTLLAAGNQYIPAIVDRLFDDATTLIDGAVVVPEIMRFQLLQHGTITIAATAETGTAVNYNYNYDVDGKWAANNVVKLSGGDTWDKATAKPVRDILAVRRKAAAKGYVITRAILNSKTWGDLLGNTTIGKDIFPLAADASLSDMDLQTYLLRKTGITFVVYDKMYTGYDGKDTAFMDDDKVIFLPGETVGYTNFGTSPEEADLMSGNVDCDVRVVNTGVAILTKKESLPVNVITSVSEIVLPSFERMKTVYVLNTLGN